MTEKPFLEGYDGQTLDELLALESAYRIDSLVLAVEDALGRKADEAGEAALSDPELRVLAVEALEREVNNGGYSQFFLNSSHRFAARIVADLEAIGCPATAAITKDAIAALGLADLTAEAVEARMESEDEALEERLDACDQAYYAAGEDIAGRLFDHIRAKRDEIRLPAG